MWAGDRDRVSVAWLKQVDDVVTRGTSPDPLDCKERSKHQLDTSYTYIVVNIIYRHIFQVDSHYFNC